MTWRVIAEKAAGWLADDEAETLRKYALDAPLLPFVEIGGYAGKSACWLGQAAKERGTVLFSVDWHRGSPEMREDRECHDPQMVGPDGFDTLPHFRRNIAAADLEPYVIPIVGNSQTVGKYWRTPLGFLFIDGAHDEQGVLADYQLWAHHVSRGGYLAFHDTTDQPIGAVANLSLDDGFTLIEEVGTLRVFQ
jgi:MMP 1-O-methyltransferase